MKMHWFVTALGGLMLLAGVILGSLIGVSVAGPGGGSNIGTIDCGSVWGGHTDVGNGEMNAADLYSTLIGDGTGRRHDYSADCDSAVSTRVVWTWSLIGVGAVLSVGGLVVRPTRTVRIASAGDRSQ